jgi:DNA-binding MarR family transcriptional regulator
MTSLNAKELEVLRRVAKDSSISQRQLSKGAGVSLGLINVILKKFIEVGYLKVSHLNKRKVKYILTPSGFLRVAENSYRFTTSIIQKYNKIYSELCSVYKDLYHKGHLVFYIHGDGELQDLARSTFAATLGDTPAILASDLRENSRAVVLNVTVEPLEVRGVKNLVNMLAHINEASL